MNLTRLRVCEEVDARLRILKARTGLTPNLLCRLGFCLSLNDPTPPEPGQYPEDSQHEIDWFELAGKWGWLLLALLRERLVQDGVDMQADMEAYFKAHLNRGVLLLYKKVRTLEDLGDLLLDFYKPSEIQSLAEVIYEEQE